MIHLDLAYKVFSKVQDSNTSCLVFFDPKKLDCTITKITSHSKVHTMLRDHSHRLLGCYDINVPLEWIAEDFQAEIETLCI